MIDRKRLGLGLGLAALLLVAGAAPAAADSKESCVDAHSRGQDERQQGHLSVARKLFLQCAQSTCPQVVQAECSQFVDDLNRIQPTITFVARDADGNDLSDTTVEVDGAVIATRLDDGRAYDIDPGKHVVRFTHAGRSHDVPIVVGTGEKGRTVIGKFPGAGPATTATTAGAASTPADAPPATPRVVHPRGAKYLVLGGAIVAAAGAGLIAWGLLTIPDNCDLSSHTCIAPPGDPVFDDASSAVTKFNIGLVAGGVGAAAAIGGLVWYFGGARRPELEEPEGMTAAPYLVPGGAGIGVTSRF